MRIRRIIAAIVAAVDEVIEHCPWCPGIGSAPPNGWATCRTCGREFQVSDGT